MSFIRSHGLQMSSASWWLTFKLAVLSWLHDSAWIRPQRREAAYSRGALCDIRNPSLKYIATSSCGAAVSPAVWMQRPWTSTYWAYKFCQSVTAIHRWPAVSRFAASCDDMAFVRSLTWCQQRSSSSSSSCDVIRTCQYWHSSWSTAVS